MFVCPHSVTSLLKVKVDLHVSSVCIWVYQCLFHTVISHYVRVFPVYFFKQLSISWGRLCELWKFMSECLISCWKSSNSFHPVRYPLDCEGHIGPYYSRYRVDSGWYHTDRGAAVWDIVEHGLSGRESCAPPESLQCDRSPSPVRTRE